MNALQENNVMYPENQNTSSQSFDHNSSQGKNEYLKRLTAEINSFNERAPPLPENKNLTSESNNKKKKKEKNFSTSQDQLNLTSSSDSKSQPQTTELPIADQNLSGQFTESSADYKTDFPSLEEAAKENYPPVKQNPRNIPHNPKTSNPKKMKDQIPGQGIQTKDLKTKKLEYSQHFPALGEDPGKTIHENDDFNPEILEAEREFAIKQEKSHQKPVDIVSAIEHEMHTTEPHRHHHKLEEQRGEEELIEALGLRSENTELMNKIVDKAIEIVQKENPSLGQSQTWDTSLAENPYQKSILVPEAENFQGIPLSPRKILEELTFVPSSSTSKVTGTTIPLLYDQEEFQKKSDLDQMLSREVVETFNEELHLPIHKIPSDFRAEPEAIKTPRNSEVDEPEETLCPRVPLEEVPQIADPSQSMSPTHVNIQKHGQFSVYGYGSPNISKEKIDQEPKTFSQVVKRTDWVNEDITQTLGSELEQKEQVMEIIQNEMEVYEGEEQRIKQDEQLKKEDLSVDPDLYRSWDVTGYRESERREIPQEICYQILPQYIGDAEENESLMQKENLEGARMDVEIQDETPGSTRIVLEDRYAPELKEERADLVAPEPELEEIQEDLAAEYGEDQNIELQKTLGRNLGGMDRPLRESYGTGKFEAAKVEPKSSLEHLTEDITLGNQSTALTLSANRFDLVREDAQSFLESSQSGVFNDVERDLQQCQELEDEGLYASQIDILKRNLEILDYYLLKCEKLDPKEMKKYLVKCYSQLAHCYAKRNNFHESVKYAKATLKIDCNDVKGIYYLGTGFYKIGDSISGYETLRKIRDLTDPHIDKDYLELIDTELRKFEDQLAEESKEKLEVEKPSFEDLTLVNKLEEEMYYEDYYEKHEKHEKHEKKEPRVSNFDMFLGTASASGALSYFVGKNFYNLPEKKNLLYSLGIAAAIGGVSVGVLGLFRDEKRKK